MRLSTAVALAAVPFLPALSAHSEPVISGFVTTPGTTQYQVNALTILCDPSTTMERVEQKGQSSGDHRCPMRYIGESVSVFGQKDKQSGIFRATAVERDEVGDLAVQGFALVDKVLVPPTMTSGTLRADGLPLTIVPTTKISFAQNSNLTMSGISTNVWVRYTGTLHPNGTVTSASLTFTPNLIGSFEDKLRTKTDFDPSTIKEEDRQGSINRFFLGPNGKKIPASHNRAAQDRIVVLGQRLIPAYQRSMPDSDPTKIDFRFQLVDDAKIHSTLSEPSGVIQVPESLPEILTDDSQLAAVLAGAVAEVLEKQSLRALPGAYTRSAFNLVGEAAGFLVPGLGFATSAVTAKNASIAEHHRLQQVARTSLSYMHDAGFDTAQAPLAWWRLADTKSKGIANTRMPYISQALYQTLASAYRPPDPLN